ncbi:LETM1 and EF-hand domain-containing protein 1, mitochondrial [Portunus trituberculatus]|uniref:LETM1 and EF-hand domain-containing protein 1, mitochondrial n=1 Tax=Portunus trituberculatus TaxID=210409 RepID=A0A5B7F8K0_PORTR|nr:LETM1 and EF-hand domain-containing protein 1, mitochondrial [Portunus trituberculatus]
MLVLHHPQLERNSVVQQPAGVRGLCVYSLEVAALRRSWHSASSVVLCQSVTSVCGGGKACGWITRGPGQHHGHCYTASPALRVSYTTVYVPAYRSFHTSVRLWEKEFSPQAASSTTSQKMVPPPESERNSNVKVKEKETLKPSSQVEVTVKDLKEKAKAAGSPIVQDKKLLFIDTKICCKYVWRIVNGENLSRREHRQINFRIHGKEWLGHSWEVEEKVLRHNELDTASDGGGSMYE